MLNNHPSAVLQALLVTFLWSTSWVLIKIGLQDIPALTFAGLRYGLAFLILLPFALRSGRPTHLRQLQRRDWGQLIALGLIYYAITQGAQFLSLAYLPAATTSLILSFTTVAVAWLGIQFLGERPSFVQWTGTGVGLLGAVIYFYPVTLPGREGIGLTIAVAGMLANAFSSILGRQANRDAKLDPLLVTLVSMGIGAAVLLVAGTAVQGLPPLTAANWLTILWLAAVNTALAFTLWNRSLQTLSAVESSIINNTMLVQIALLAWLFLDEDLSAKQLVGMALATAGTLLVQLRQRPRSKKQDR